MAKTTSQNFDELKSLDTESLSNPILYNGLSYEAASPDDCVLFAGPARWTDGSGNFEIIGLVQDFNVASGARVAQLPGIGTRRKMPQRGSAVTSIDMSRVYLKVGNLLKVLYNQQISALTDQDVSLMKDKATKDMSGAVGNNSAALVALMDLDSDLFYVPIGFGFVIRNRARQQIGIGYLESALVESWNFRLAAGGDMAIVEQVRLSGDRCRTIEGKLVSNDLHKVLTKIHELNA